MTRRASGVLTLVFLLAHLAMLPRSLEDLDSINFALGVRQFDVARHQPHPPGYPVFIALSKISTSVLRGLGVSAPAPRGLAIWSAMGGALAIPAMFLFLSALERRRALAWWATLVAAASPLYWFNALRPLSDMSGFAAAAWAIALIALRTDRSVVAGAALAGLAIGIRSQSAVLTAPLLAFVLLSPGAITPRARLTAALALPIAALVWGVPLLLASGGLSGYLRALGTQAGEDFSGVVMLWTHRTPHAAASALANTFIWPWGWWPGIVVCAIAAAGALRLSWRSPRVAVLLAVTFGPYAVFHLLFQETVTTRYALPLIPLVAYCAMAAVQTRRRLTAAAAGGTLAAVSLLVTLPAAAVYARDGAPIFRAFDEMAITSHSGERVDVLGMHAGSRRAAEWAEPILPAPVARAPHGREWLALVAAWQANPAAQVWFAADPKRTDLALFDGRARELAKPYRWGFDEPPFVGGARPNDIDWYRMAPPGWMLDRGWAITAEVAGVTARDGLGPQVAPSVAWIRQRPEESTLIVGGRNLGPGGPATIAVAIAGRPFTSWTVPPGFFVKTLTVPAGALTGASSYVPLGISSSPATRAVSLEQFDLQGPAVPMVAFADGWQEPEFNPETGRSWRWMSEQAVLWVRPIGRDVIVRLDGESPLRYYGAPPHVQILVGDREIGAFDPASDFQQETVIPASALAAAGGRVTMKSSRFFVPGGSGGGGDQRHLAIRVYSVSVR